MKSVFSIIVGVSVVLGALSSIPTARGQAVKSTTDVFLLADPDMVVGESMLVRNPNGITVVLETSGIPAGDAVTMWWVVFNNPTACTDPCNLDDVIADPNTAMADVLFAAGHVVGNGGQTTFASHLAVGDASGSIRPVPIGLLDPFGAEIHLVVRSHGPMIPGMVDDQISAVNGGCPPNVCMDIQAAIHEP